MNLQALMDVVVIIIVGCDIYACATLSALSNTGTGYRERAQVPLSNNPDPTITDWVIGGDDNKTIIGVVLFFAAVVRISHLRIMDSRTRGQTSVNKFVKLAGESIHAVLRHGKVHASNTNPHQNSKVIWNEFF